MLDFTHRSLQKELLDRNDIPFEDIRQNLKELNTINTVLGGHQITLDGVFALSNLQNFDIAEIGCGGGDNLAFIKKKLANKGFEIKLTGIDMKGECIAYAKSQNPDINFICSDYKDVTFSAKPDIIFSSLFCHHFTDEELAGQLTWMKENSRIGFFINDLHRHSFAYYSIKLLTSLFSKSYLVKNDAPLSVARGFKRREWEKIFEKAGIQSYTIQWKWAFRYLICYKHE